MEPTAPPQLEVLNRPAAGFRGIWYANQPGGPYYFKYSGAMATYPQQHAPIAIHRPDVRRTYFVYGASDSPQPQPEVWGNRNVIAGDTLCAISYYDHERGLLARPMELVRRNFIDAHENPVLCIDPEGHLLVFCPGHGAHRHSCLLRSTRPHDISDFQEIGRWESGGGTFSYPQPWWIDGVGVVLLHTHYEEGKRRRLATLSSRDGVDWSNWDQPRYLSKMAEGSYQISWPGPHGIVGTAFDQHPLTPNDNPLNWRTNLYYAQTRDGGASWQTVDGRPLELPLIGIDNPALVLDAAAQGRLVYLKDLQFDAAGWPVILYLTSFSPVPGPEAGPFEWWIARYEGDGRWAHRRNEAACSDHNYDHGSLLLLAEDDWRLLAPVEPGPQPFATGGTMCLLRSRDRGDTWEKARRVVRDEANNHSYARRPLHPNLGFAFLWGAADSYRFSPATLYFADAEGNAFAMPRDMTADFAAPIPMAGG